MKKICSFLSLFVIVCAVFCSALFQTAERTSQSPKSVSASAFAENEPHITLPVVMYHSLSKNKSGDYTVTANQFENDIRQMTEDGYTTILGGELVSYLSGKGKLPEKPIMIVFDDGHYNNVLYGEPILKKYGAKAIINVVGKYVDNTVSVIDKFYAPTSYLTWDMIKGLNVEMWEIGSHTYDMHNYRPRFGMGRKFRESDESYISALKADNDKMVEKLKSVGISTNIFAFPFGKVTETAVKFLSDSGYKILFSCREKVNSLPLPDKDGTAGTSALMLHRFNRRGNYSNNA